MKLFKTTRPSYTAVSSVQRWDSDSLATRGSSGSAKGSGITAAIEIVFKNLADLDKIQLVHIDFPRGEV